MTPYEAMCAAIAAYGYTHPATQQAIADYNAASKR